VVLYSLNSSSVEILCNTIYTDNWLNLTTAATSDVGVMSGMYDIGT